jgi:hypothetical protein
MKMLRVRTAALPMLGLSLGLLLSACGGTDDSDAVSDAGAGEVAVEASDDSDAVSDAGAGEVAVEASDDATPETDLVEADDTAGNDTPEALAVRPDSVVTWLDTEFRIPAPWSVRATDGGAIWLEHPSAAGQGGSVYVYMLAEDGQLTAEHMAGNPPVTASGEVMETKELDAVFATGGPGLQVGAARSQLVTIFSDTGISVSINRDEGTLTEEAVATVLALLATIEPPAVTPSTEAVVDLEAGLRERESIWGRDLTGTEGWDSSDFYDQVPLNPPAGSRLLDISDGPADGQARYWMYVLPQGMTPQDACKMVLANTGGLEVYQQGVPCEPPNEESYTLRLRGDDNTWLDIRDGPYVMVTAVQAEVPCPDGTFGCSQLLIAIIDFGWSSRR